MSTARTSTLASLRGRIERIEAHGDAHASTRSRSAMRQRMRCCAAVSRVAAVHEVFAEGHQSAAATGFIAGLAGRVIAAPAAGLGAAGFFGN